MNTPTQPITVPTYNPEWDEDAWSFPRVLPVDGWVSESRPLNPDDRSRFRFDIGLRCAGVAFLALVMGFALRGLIRHGHGPTPWFITALPVVSLSGGLAYCLWGAWDALRILRTMAKSHVLIVRFKRPEGANWPDEYSPPFEYLSETREMWGYHPLGADSIE